MKIPKEIGSIVEKLEKKGYEAYLVGGCVRDLLRNVDPEDWDVATNAKPEEIQKIFPKSFCNNKSLLLGQKKNILIKGIQTKLSGQKA